MTRVLIERFDERLYIHHTHGEDKCYVQLWERSEEAARVRVEGWGYTKQPGSDPVAGEYEKTGRGADIWEDAI
jgi:hypothetical protein